MRSFAGVRPDQREEVPTAPLSSLKRPGDRSRLEGVDQQGEFLLQEPVSFFPGANPKPLEIRTEGDGPLSKRRVVLTFPPSLVELPITTGWLGL